MLPCSLESTFAILSYIFEYLDSRSLCNLKCSSLIHQFCKVYDSDYFKSISNDALEFGFMRPRSINEILIVRYNRLVSIIKKCQTKYQNLALEPVIICQTKYQNLALEPVIISPFICACQKGSIDDVQLFVNFLPIYMYITNSDLKDHIHVFSQGYDKDFNKTLKKMVNQEGKRVDFWKSTPLKEATKNEHFHIIKYLIELGADPNIISAQWNAFHIAAVYSKKNTKLIDLLLEHASYDGINSRGWRGYTPQDIAYRRNKSPIKQEIINRLGSKRFELTLDLIKNPKLSDNQRICFNLAIMVIIGIIEIYVF